MLRMTIITIFILWFSQLTAPPSGGIAIEVSEGINPYKTIIHAIGEVESKHDTLAYNPGEGATGYFQIREIRLRDYNERTGECLTMTDMYDYHKAERVFLYYATQFRYDDYRSIARDWNKSRTNRYWNRVKKHI